MGKVIDFPAREANARHAAPEHRGRDLAQVIILPVIRIERYDDQPAGYFSDGGRDQGRKRRRRASRS